MSKTTFGDDFRRFFLRGLAAVLPTVITIGIIFWVFGLIQTYAGRYVNVGLCYIVALVWAVQGYSGGRVGDAFVEATDFWADYHLWWVGFVFAIVAIYIVGRFVASYIGRGLWRVLESTFHRLPVIKLIYPHVKQVTDFLLSERKIEFSRVVMVQYPREGIWSLGLVTSPGMLAVQEQVGSDMLTVFIPSSPTPVTGYTITVFRSDVIDLPISIDEALKFTISGGVILPLGQRTAQSPSPDDVTAVLPADRLAKAEPQEKAT